MPFIHVKSLPFEQSVDIPNIIQKIALDFSLNTGIELKHIHTTWEFFKARHYAKGDQVFEFQARSDCPIIVDLLTPDFNSTNTIATMLTSIADSISNGLPIAADNVFINHRRAYSGMVYDEASIVKW